MIMAQHFRLETRVSRDEHPILLTDVILQNLTLATMVLKTLQVENVTDFSLRLLWDG